MPLPNLQFYPLVVLDQEGQVNEWTSLFLQQNKPNTPREQLVIACMDQNYRWLETCSYRGTSLKIARFGQKFELTLKEAVSGKDIASEVFRGLPMECPTTFKEYNTYDWYGLVQMSEFYAWIDDYLP